MICLLIFLVLGAALIAAGTYALPLQEPDPAAAPPPAFVFDDTPAARIIDHGLELDLDLGVAELDLGQSQLRDIALGARLSGQRLELAPFSLRGLNGKLRLYQGSGLVTATA